MEHAINWILILFFSILIFCILTIHGSPQPIPSQDWRFKDFYNLGIKDLDKEFESRCLSFSSDTNGILYYCHIKYLVCLPMLDKNEKIIHCRVRY